MVEEKEIQKKRSHMVEEKEIQKKRAHMVEDCDDLFWIEDPQLLRPDAVPEDARKPKNINSNMKSKPRKLLFFQY